MGILDSVKKGAAEVLKTVAEEALKKSTPTSAKATPTSAAAAKAEALVGSKATGTMSPPQAASPANLAAAAKAAALVGSKAPPKEQSYTEPYSQSYSGWGSNQLQPAEVEAIIEARVKANGRPSNWRVSIVDLMSAFDMNSSLDARKALAARLNYSGYAPDGSAEKNMWLHAELLRILALNRGEMPWELKEAVAAGSMTAQNVTQYAGVNGLTPEVEAIIEARVRAKGRPSNWRLSIVDLMSALDMNSSLDARRVLAARLNYSGSAADGTAEKNLWLHAELLKTLAQNRGEVPSYLL